MRLSHSPSRSAVFAAAFLLVAPAGGAAQEIAERELAKPNATLKEAVRNPGAALPLADGRLLFTAGAGGLFRADFGSGAADEVLARGGGEDQIRVVGATAGWTGDSVAVIDNAGGRLMILGADAKYVRSIRMMGPRATFTRAGGTSHLVGRLDPPRVQAPNPNAAPPRVPYALVRKSLQGGPLDTLAQILPLAQGRPQQYFNGTGTMALSIPPGYQHVDAWTVLSDGTVAIVRAATYRFNFIAPDGTRSETAPVPYQKLALGDEDRKLYLADSKRTMGEGVVSTAQRPVTAINWAEPTVWPAEHPPFRGELGVVRGTDDRMWLATRCAKDAKASCYDVIDRTGARVARYRLPANTVVLAATGDAVYTVNQQKSDKHLLQRHPL